MHLQPSATRQRLGRLLALSLTISFIFAGVASVQAAYPAEPWLAPRNPALRTSRVDQARLTRVSGRTIGAPAALAAETVLSTGAAAAPVAEPVTSVVEAVVPVAELEQPAAPAPQSELDSFVATVVDGRSGVLRGVYVPGVLALRVVQQSASAPYFVSLAPGVATQFSTASAYGVTGLLADNVASGVQFFGLAPGQTVSLIYGDGAIRRYTVNGLYSYQALSPNDPYSDFVNLSSGARLSAIDLFNQMYTGGDKITFQTCIAQDGVLSWGRLFVSATPAQ